jgi:hypothetical protein
MVAPRQLPDLHRAFVRRHTSTGGGLATPEIVSDLRTGGWSYSGSREGVADTDGVLVG